MESHLRTELVLAALDMAVAQRRPTAVIHHSDTPWGEGAVNDLESSSPSTEPGQLQA
jgi:hypothetical protein